MQHGAEDGKRFMTQQIVSYVDTYRPGALSTLCALQTQYYARDWGFDHTYEAVVSAGMGEFLSRYNPATDLTLLAISGDDIIGGIVIDGGDQGHRSARLRWYIVAENFRGCGVGRSLIERAMKFIRRQEYENVFLTTFDGLTSARNLYEKAGFHLVDQVEKSTWGKPVMEQRFEFFSSK